MRNGLHSSAPKGLTGHNIICFAKDWKETPTSNNHVMAELARTNKVLWLNSIATRQPDLTSARDIRKIFQKLASFLGGTKHVQDQLWVFTPVVLPFPHSKIAAILNRLILKLTLGRIRRQLNMRDFQLWTFLPNAAEYVGKLGESLVVYYCVDEWSKFTYLHGKKAAEAERRLLESADIVFATAQTLVDDRLPLNRETHLARHGVDHALFARAMDDRTEVPADIAALPRPVLGFYGTIQDWIDFDLLCFLARRHPEWSIVMLGSAFVDVSRLRQLPNIHLLGRKEHAQLPNYCKGFDVGIIPYVVNERIRHVNPIKLREYLSAGLPVVSTAFPEVQRYPEFCTAAATFEEFEGAIEASLRTDTTMLRRRRCEAMRGETWEKKVAEVGEQVLRVEKVRALESQR
ncbi:MAG TPA: glycosyltransferase [Isosphaeraceae bacterium]|nr:glycosyltransferase [Isosphaeraceae bacterium]